jgi:glycogen(starch) synthase
MRILMACWEFPPLVIGGLATHVDGLSRALARQGHEVVVLTLHHPDVPDDYEVDGVRVLRAHADLPWIPDEWFTTRMASANHHLVQLAAHLDGWKPDLVHAHDWLVAWCGDTLHELLGVPLVATIHATEKGRNRGDLPPGQPSVIHAIEWWLGYQSDRVIACSDYMVDQVMQAFDLPAEKVDMVPNGVDADTFAPPPGVVRGERGPLVVSWGRVQHEKGFQTVIEAMAFLRHRVPGIHAVVAGRGGHLGELQHQAARMNVSDIVHFAGFLPDADLRHLLHTASCAVIPSLYEPFGIVALEALAARAPLVAASTGGLTEVLEGGEAGLLYPPGDAGALAHAIERMCTEPGLAERCQAEGDRLARTVYSWDAVAAATLPVYDKVLACS